MGLALNLQITQHRKPCPIKQLSFNLHLACHSIFNSDIFVRVYIKVIVMTSVLTFNDLLQATNKQMSEPLSRLLLSYTEKTWAIHVFKFLFLGCVREKNTLQI